MNAYANESTIHGRFKVRSKSIYILIVLICMAVLSGCAKNEFVDNSDAGNTVDVLDNRFNPSPIIVPVGTTIVWTHKGNSVHTITSGTRQNETGQFDSGDLNKGNTYRFTFNTVGTYVYFCRHHGGMDGTIIVE